MNSEFYQKLLFKVMSSLPNDHEDNYDKERFGEVPKAKSLGGKVYESPFFTRRFFNKSNQIALFRAADKFLNDPEFHKFQDLYDMLADAESKALLIDLVAYRMLGYKRVKLPLNNPEYWNKLEKCGGCQVESASPTAGSQAGLFNLQPIGYDLKIYFSRLGILTDFLVEQYKYTSKDKTIEVESGDVVIDGGGFWGDTALYFASKAGGEGKVFTFEFIPGNLKMLRENLALNPHVSTLVDVVEHPLWEKSEQNFYYKDLGPASSVSTERLNGDDQMVKSKSIDTLVAERQLSKVDFIKMDIEGAEPYALKGAEQTIRKFKPNLAIAIYHSTSDFVNIPAYIHSLGLGYKLYLGHYTTFEEETLIFATTK